MNLLKNHISVSRLFWLLLVVSVLPVWVFPNFLTADGPCHVYNSTILRHWWQGDISYYDQFYKINNEADPNWFSHVLLAALQYIFSPTVADKIVITLCVAVFATGFRYYVNGLAARQSYMSLWVFAFVWQLAMYMGFYNYMYSIGVYFWLSGLWLRYRWQMDWMRIAGAMLACVILYFMHLLGLFLFYATIGLFFITDLLVLKKEDIKKVLRQLLYMLVITLPSLLMSGYYVLKDNNENFDTSREPFKQLLWKLIDLFSIQSITRFDTNLSKATSYFLIASGFFTVFYLLIKRPKGAQWVAPLVLTAATMFAYFFAYQNMLGGSYIQPRLEVLVFIFTLLFIASVPLPRVYRNASLFVSVILVLGFTGNRMKTYKEISDIVAEFKGLDKHIDDQSVILPLKYDLFPKGKDGDFLAHRVLLFSHITETIGVESKKKLIFCDNYEGFTYYFPIIWKEEISPYYHLATGEGIEAVPPEAKLAEYNEKFVPVDYIIIWGRNSEIEKLPATQKMDSAIHAYYDMVEVTDTYKIELYKLKNKAS